MDRLLKDGNPLGFLILFIVLAGCTPTGNNNLSITVKSVDIDIPIGAEYLSSYYDSDFFHKDGNSFFIGYNHTTHSFDYFDLKNQKAYKSIHLDNEGPGGIPSVGRFAANNNFITAIYGNTFIFFLSHDGHVIKKIRFDDIQGTDGLSLAPLELTFGNFSRISFSDTSILHLPVYQRLKRRENSFYNHFYIMEIHFDGEEINTSLTMCDFPKVFRENFYGDLDLPYVGLLNGNLVYNFPVLPKLFRLGGRQHSIDILTLESAKPQNMTSPFNKAAYTNSAARRDYFFNSPRFFYPLYDPYRKLHYIVRKNKTESPADKYKENFLMIFNKDFEYLHEVRIDPSLTPIYDIIEAGLVFSYNPKSIKDENHLSFRVMDVTVK